MAAAGALTTIVVGVISPVAALAALLPPRSRPDSRRSSPTRCAVRRGLALPAADLADRHVERAVLIGIDVGPNFSTVGSLATLLWLLILRRKAVGISLLDYVRESWIPSGLALAVALTLLAITAPRI